MSALSFNFVFDGYKAALERAATIPDIDEDEDEDEEEEESPELEPIYLGHLEELVGVVRQAAASKAEGKISEDEWTIILNEADRHISELCRIQYDEDYTSCVKPYGLPTVGENHIKSKGYLPTTMFSNPFFQDFLATLTGDGDDFNMSAFKEKMLDKGTIPKPWSETQRPHPSSTPLSRFAETYDSEALIAAEPDMPETALAVLQARAEVQVYDTPDPWGMAIGGNVLAISGAGGYKQRSSAMKRFDITIPEPDEEESWMEEHSMRSGLAGPYKHLFVDSYAIWAAGDERIKAFVPGTGKLMHTLNSDGYEGMFGVCERGVFRANESGEFALWNRSDWITHLPVTKSTPTSAGIEPLDGLLDEEKHMGWLDENGIAKVELSLGQAPTAKFKIPNFVGPIGCLAPVPGSTQFICATGTSSGAESRVPASFGLRLLDLAAPEKSASVVGLGLGSAVADIKTHQDLPNLFIAAGDDRLARIFDLRAPLPHIVLDGHSGDVTSCAVSTGGRVVFTGGHDELVKAWDIRYTKVCLYELSAGTLRVEGLGWHDGRQSLFIMGQNVHEDRFGRHYADDYSGNEGQGYWPKNASRSSNYFGKPWFSTTHGIVEYQFKANANPKYVPFADEPSFS